MNFVRPILLSAIFVFSLKSTARAESQVDLEGATVICEGGAEGHLAVESNGDLAIEKTNGKGKMRVALRSFNLTAGPAQVAILSFATPQWNYGIFFDLKLRLITQDGSDLNLVSDQVSSTVLPCLPEKSNRRFLAIPATPDTREAFFSLELSGNPGRLLVQHLELQDPAKGARATKAFRPDEPVAPDEADRLLALRTPLDASMQEVGQRALLNFSGTSVPPVLYSSHPEPKASQFQLFSRLGVNVHLVNVPVGPYQRIGDQISPGVWVAKGKYNFQLVDDLANRAVESAPGATLILALSLTPYPSWGDENPDEIIANEKGEKGVAVGAHNIAYRNVRQDTMREYWCPSLSSEKYVADTKEFLEQLFEHLKKQPYYKAVGGFFLAGGDDGQWQPWARAGWENRGDYSPAGTAGFRAWLRRQYGSPEALRSAWAMPGVTFENAAVPPLAERDGTDMFLDPATEKRAIDYTTFECASKALLVDRLGEYVKSAAGKPVLVGCYFQDQLYGHTFSYEENERISSRGLDFFVSPLDYGPWRRPGWMGGEFSVSPDSLALHQKLYLCELDLRTVTSRKTSEAYDYGVIGSLDGREAFDAVNLRATGLMLNYGMGQWYYEIAAGSFAVDYAMQGIQQAVRLQETMLSSRDVPDSPKVAVFSDGRVNSYIAHPYQNALLFPALNITRSSLFLSGVSCALYGMEDLMNPHLPEYSVYVFLDSWYLSEEQRKFIKSKLQRNGKTLVWVGPAGYLDETGQSTSRIADIVGIDLGEDTRVQKLTVEARPDSAKPFDALLPRQGTAWPDLAGLKIKVQDSQATPIGWYANSEEVANAVKRGRDYQTVFIASPGGLGPDLLNAICRYAGVPVTSQFGNGVVLRGGVLTLHGVAGGNVPITLPKTSSLTDLLGRDAVRKDVRDLEINLKPGETKLFKVDASTK